MKKNRPSKVCVACGLEKPLTAYLQITGPGGTSLGEVCSTCRGSGQGRKVVLPNFEEDSSGSGSGLKIDAKTKIQTEADIKALLDKKEEKDKHHKDKKGIIQEEHLERKELKTKEEKDHREGFIEAKKKDTFLGFRPKKSEQTPATFNTKDREASVSKAEHDATTEEKEAVDKKENQTHGERKTKDDVSLQFTDQHTTTISRDNPFYRAWESLIGESLMAKTVRRQFNAVKHPTDPTNPNNKANPTNPANQTKAETNKNKNPAVDFITENFEAEKMKSPKARRP